MSSKKISKAQPELFEFTTENMQKKQHQKFEKIMEICYKTLLQKIFRIIE